VIEREDLVIHIIDARHFSKICKKNEYLISTGREFFIMAKQFTFVDWRLALAFPFNLDRFFLMLKLDVFGDRDM
jgi:hypothetical protein